MNVLFVSETRFTHTPYRDGSTRYRCFHMAEALQSVGHLADVSTLEAIDLANLSRYDVVSVHRPDTSKKLLSVLERCSKLGIKTVADIDSLEFDPGLARQSSKCQLRNASLASVRAAFMSQQRSLGYFDEVSVATEELARARRAQDPSQCVYVVPNGLSNFWLSCNDKIQVTISATKRISFFSSRSCVERDFAQASDAIAAFLKNTPSAQFNIVGPLDLDGTTINPAQTVRGAWTDFMNMPAELANTWVSISPLEKNGINYAKPHTKFIESAAFGIPLVCSPTADLERHNVPGLHLVESTKQWRTAFEELSDENYYRTCQKQLQEYARDCCLASHSAATLIEQWCANPETSNDETVTTLSAAS